MKTGSLLTFVLTFATALVMLLYAYDVIGLGKIGVDRNAYGITAISFSNVFGMVSVICFIFNRKKKKEDLSSKGPITAVLYDSKVDHVVGIVYIAKTEAIRGILYWPNSIFPLQAEKNTKRYHFFCIQDDGKHIFIERG